MRTIMKYSYRLLQDPKNYDAWLQFSLAGTFAHNGILGLGREQDWSNHRIEDEMAASYDITHGEGLAVIAPAWMEYVYKRQVPMFVQFAVNVMGVDSSLREPEQIAREGIAKFCEWIAKMNLPSHMGDIGIDTTRYEEMAKRASKFRDGQEEPVGAFVKLGWEDIVNIYNLAT